MPPRKLSKPQQRLEQLAKQLLPLIQATPNMAYAAKLADNFRGGPSTRSFWGTQWKVGDALNLLRKRKLATSKLVNHPEGRPGRAKLYTLTDKGREVLAKQTAAASPAPEPSLLPEPVPPSAPASPSPALPA